MSPLYGNSAPPCLYQGDIGYLFGTSAAPGIAAVGDSPTTGQFSQSFTVFLGEGNGGSQSISLEVTFSGNPGAFNYQLQEANTDVTGAYNTIPLAGGTVTACTVTAGGAYVYRVDFPRSLTGTFYRMFVQTQTANAVTVIAKLCAV